MVPKSHFHHVIIMFLILSSLYITSSSDTHTRANFDKWVSWNVNNYHQKNILEAKWKASASRSDLKLSMAESNKVRITVSQDGAGDFKTITEAINSIPLRNTGRVIVSIAPAVYRCDFNGYASLM